MMMDLSFVRQMANQSVAGTCNGVDILRPRPAPKPPVETTRISVDFLKEVEDLMNRLLLGATMAPIGEHRKMVDYGASPLYAVRDEIMRIRRGDSVGEVDDEFRSAMKGPIFLDEEDEDTSLEG